MRPVMQTQDCVMINLGLARGMRWEAYGSARDRALADVATAVSASSERVSGCSQRDESSDD
jgi:hypothetical protein